MQHLLSRFERLFSDAAAGTGGDQSGTGGQGDSGQAGNGGQGSWKAPEGLPQEFAGANADEALGKLLGGYNDLNNRFGGMREKLSKMPAPPEKPEAYAFQPSDGLKDYFGDLSADPVYGAAQKAAHKYGMSQEQFAGFINDTFGPLAQEGLLLKPYNPENEIKSYMEATGLDAKAASTALDSNMVFAKGIAEQLQIPDKFKTDVQATLMGLTDTAVGNALLAGIANRLGDVGIRVGGQGGAAGALTKEDLKALDQDPRIDPRNREHADPAKRFDEGLRKRYDEAYQRLYPSR